MPKASFPVYISGARRVSKNWSSTENERLNQYKSNNVM
jgi:hypothetical protein